MSKLYGLVLLSVESKVGERLLCGRVLLRGIFDLRDRSGGCIVVDSVVLAVRSCIFGR